MLVVLLIAAATVDGCARRPSSRSSSLHQLKKSDLTAAELKYGIAPIPDASVAYQPAVVVVGGGADAVRALSPTGLTWTIDAHAPHASELTEGKIIFLTNRAVGRVLDVRRDGGNLAVTLGPVAITEIIKKCDIHIDAMPIDFSEAIAYEAPELPGRVIAAPGSAELRPWDGQEVGVATVAFTTQSAPPAGSQAGPVPDVSNLVHFKVVPTRSREGIGLRATSDGGGLKVSAEAFVHIHEPTLTPVLKISDDGDLLEATLRLSGAAGLTLKFDVGTDVGRKANVNGRLQAVPDFSIPLGGGPVPVALTVRQQIIIQTALGVRNSTLSAVGDYTFTGAFQIGYAGKKWGLAAPTGFTAKQTLLQTADGISIAPSGVDFTHQMKVVFGVGAWGLVTGPYFSLNSSAGLFKGSDLGMIQCKEATIVVGMSGGIGYLIPKPITDAINFILGTLHIRYRVNSEGGISSDPMTIINKTPNVARLQGRQGVRSLFFRRCLALAPLALLGAAGLASGQTQTPQAADARSVTKIGIAPFVDATGSGNRAAGADIGRTMQAEVVHTTALVPRLLTLDGSARAEDLDADTAIALGRAQHVDLVFVGTVLEARSEESNKSGWIPSIKGQSGNVHIRRVKATVTLQGELYDVASGQRLFSARSEGHETNNAFSGTAFTNFGSWGNDTYGAFLDSPLGKALRTALADMIRKVTAARPSARN